VPALVSGRVVAPGTLAVHDNDMNDVSMNSGDWRDYATALDNAARSLEAFTGRLAAAAAGNELFDPGEGVDGYRTLKTTNGTLVNALREQARQARFHL
jgi:hypothetical protein